MAIILRLDKGSELTFAEVDGNFSSLFYSANLVGTNLNFYTYPNVLASTVDLSTIPGFGGITVQKDGNTIINAATGLNFAPISGLYPNMPFGIQDELGISSPLSNRGSRDRSTE